MLSHPAGEIEAESNEEGPQDGQPRVQQPRANEPLRIADRMDARETTTSSQFINYIVFQSKKFIRIHYCRMSDNSEPPDPQTPRHTILMKLDEYLQSNDYVVDES